MDGCLIGLEFWSAWALKKHLDFTYSLVLASRLYFSSRRKVAKAARGPPTVDGGVGAPGPPGSNQLGRAGLAGATPPYDCFLEALRYRLGGAFVLF